MSAKTTHPLFATETTALLLSGSQLPRFVADKVNPLRGRRMSHPSVSPEPPPGGFISYLQRALGFSRRYNIKLFLALAVPLAGYSIIRLKYLDPSGLEVGLLRQEWYSFREGYPKIGLLSHLACVLPAGILGTLQFIPKIRCDALWFHRINGYVTTNLMLLALVGAVFIARYSYGGELSLQLAIYMLALIVSSSLILAITSIRNLKVDAHRRWMLRAWSYASAIITIRIIVVLSVAFVGWRGNTYSSFSCRQTAFILNNDTIYSKLFPVCQSDSSQGSPDVTDTYVLIRATLQDTLGIESSVRATVAMATWLAMIIHGLCVEVYLGLTPDENTRLKRYSVNKQLLAEGHLIAHRDK